MQAQLHEDLKNDKKKISVEDCTIIGIIELKKHIDFQKSYYFIKDLLDW